MRTRLALRRALTAGAALAIAIVTVPAAQGRTVAGGGEHPGVERYAAARTVAEQRAVIEYWTPARMRAAIPKGLKANPNKGKPGSSTPSGAEAVSVPTDPKFGKVFFTEGGLNYVCSGTVTKAANKSLVTTAGHCVNDGSGTPVTNFAFVPAYLDDDRQLGTYAATTLYTTTQWATKRDFDHDIGFAVMGKLNGSTLESQTKAFPIAFNLGYGRTFDAYGYPAARPYDGGSLWKCSGPTTKDTRGSTDNRLPCTMTGGSSGGGWITTSGSAKVLNSLNSFGYRGEKDVMYGPYFGSVEEALYTVAQG
jgi:hypothetical protein